MSASPPFIADDVKTIIVPAGANIAIDVSFELTDGKYVASFAYDSNTDDDTPSVPITTSLYSGTFGSQRAELETYAFGSGFADLIVDDFSLKPISDLYGDFDGDGMLSFSDIDLLAEHIPAAYDVEFDLNGDAISVVRLFG